MKKELIIKGLEMILEGMKEDVQKEPEKSEVRSVEQKEPEKKVEKGNVQFNEEELREMKYSDLKKFASEIGVSAKGKRDEIIANILAQNVEVTVEEVKEEVPDNIVEFPKEKVSDEVDYLEMAKEATEGMSLDEIREVLEDHDIETEGMKKKELIGKVAKALEEGIIEIDDEEDSEDFDEEVLEDSEEIEEDFDEEDEDDEDDDEEEIDENTYFDVFDDGANDPEDVTSEERLKAIVKLQKDIINDYETEALTDEDIEKFLKDNLTEDELEDFNDEDADEMDKFAMYCEYMKRLINDDGERMPMGEPYEITIDGEVYDYCCGHELEETDNGYVCEVCGEVYEADE